MPKSSARSSAELAPQPLFDAESTRKMIVALGRCAAASIASGVALSTGQPQTIEATLRIQREVYNAFTSLAYRDPSMPALTELAQEEPVTKVLSALNRFGAAAIAAGVIGSSGKRHSIGDAMRTYYRVVATMWPTAAGVSGHGAGDDPSAEAPTGMPELGPDLGSDLGRS
jgi:hypothetical protein